MKLAFFIGHHKTGSTSLQNYLATNYLPLLKAGILYPAVESQGIAKNLAAVLHRYEESHSRNLNVIEPHNALAFELIAEAKKKEVPRWHKNLPSAFQMFQLIEAQFEALNPEHTIISSEVMSRFAEPGWQKILPRISTRFAQHDCSVTLNLRRIDDHLASWQLQLLKFGDSHAPLRSGAQQRFQNTVHFRYDLILKRWSKALPDARFIVRNYADVMAAGGTVVDFFAQNQIDFQSPLMAQNLNPSVPYAMAEILRRANSALPNHQSEMLAYILDAAQRVDYIPNREIELFGPINRAALLATFKPVHRQLSDLLGLDAFFPDLEEVSICRPISELTAAQETLQMLRRDAAQNAACPEVCDFLSALEIME